jgi:hypothetical protein
MWARYRALKSQGLPVWQVGRKKLSAAPPTPPRAKPKKPGPVMSDEAWLKAIGVIK